MNKHIFKIIILVALFAGSCSDFGDMNVDPNNPSNPNTAALLAGSMRAMPGLPMSTQPMEYVQLITQNYYTNSSRYSTTNFSYNGRYSGALADLQEIIRLNSDPDLAAAQLGNGDSSDQIAVARILKAWWFWQTTDAWGDIPYSEALAGRENFRPNFDDQQSVYQSLFSELKEAADQLDPNGSIEGDILFGGDLSKWRMFANSIRFNMALRLSEVDEGTAQTEFNAAMSAGVISSSDENVIYQYLTDDNNDNPWEDRFQTRRDWTIAKPLMDYLNETNDPRRTIFANVALNSQTYEGMPYGLNQEDAGQINQNDVSFIGDAVRQQDSPAFIMTYARVLFSKAEAAHRGWIGGGEPAAEQYYLDAIKASWEQWGVYDEAAYNDFIAHPMIAYDAADAMNKIHMQKWVSLFNNGFEAWAEWRRTGIPSLEPAPEPLSAVDAIPVRYGYPLTERDLNGTNYDAQVAKMGGEDDLHIKVWWDK